MTARYPHVGTRVHILICKCTNTYVHTTHVHTQAKITKYQRQFSEAEKNIDKLQNHKRWTKRNGCIYFLYFVSLCKVHHLDFYEKHWELHCLNLMRLLFPKSPSVEVLSKLLAHWVRQWRGEIWDCSAQLKYFTSSSDEWADLSVLGKKAKGMPTFHASTNESSSISLHYQEYELS